MIDAAHRLGHPQVLDSLRQAPYRPESAPRIFETQKELAHLVDNDIAVLLGFLLYRASHPCLFVWGDNAEDMLLWIFHGV